MKITITGANSSVGRNLLSFLAAQPPMTLIAGVRSESARADLPVAENIDPRIISYQEPDGLQEAMEGADCLIHLAGILIETRHSSYASANVAATAAVCAAARAAGVKHIILISVVGADHQSSNAYFRSKGEAEKIVEDSELPASIIRTPVLLGPGTAAANSLLAMVTRSRVRVPGGGHYQQRPLDIDDLNVAIGKICGYRPPEVLERRDDKGRRYWVRQWGDGLQKEYREIELQGCILFERGPPAPVTIYELAGPEAISYRDLLSRAAGISGGNIDVRAVPVWLAKAAAAMARVFRGGGISPTVINVITMNEHVHRNADAELGLRLTPLQQTLEKILNGTDHE